MSSTPPKASKAPRVIRRGACEVRIYTTSNTVAGHDYEQFVVVHSKPEGGRVRRKFSDKAEAERAAEAIATKLANGQTDVLKLTNADATHYVEAVAALRPFDLTISAAVGEFVTARRALPPGVTLAEAVADYARRHPSNLPNKTVAEVVVEMLADKRAAGCSEAHLRDLDNRLGRFAKAFRMPLSSVTAPMVKEYLRSHTRENGQPVTNRTRRNVQRIVTGLFHFARKQRYILRELVDEVAEIDAPKIEHVETGIFTPEQLRKILYAAAADIRPALAIGAFCGLRTAELQRLDWKEVKLAEGVVIVGADKAKTASRRVVPIPDNAKLWLASHAKTEGPVSPAPNDRAMNHRFDRTAAREGVKWVKNGLRHSFCSYRLAVTHDPARVATEAGNSANMIHSHYKALVSEAQGKDWFAIVPENRGADVLPLPLASAA